MEEEETWETEPSTLSSYAFIQRDIQQFFHYIICYINTNKLIFGFSFGHYTISEGLREINSPREK
jgi:hypothetical protein